MGFRTIAGTVLAAIMLAPSALAQAGSLELINDTAFDLEEVYAAAPGSGQWGSDLLGGGFLPQGNRADLVIGEDGQQCSFDLRFVLSGGDKIEENAVDICATGSYTLSN